jgi:hypothetical protein
LRGSIAIAIELLYGIVALRVILIQETEVVVYFDAGVVLFEQRAGMAVEITGEHTLVELVSGSAGIGAGRCAACSASATTIINTQSTSQISVR